MPLTKDIISRIQGVCGAENVLTHPDELLVYESDAYPLARKSPRLVAFPTSTEATAQLLALLFQEKIPFVPRGAGTSLAGGCLATDSSLCVSLARMRKIREISLEDGYAVVEAGVITQQISDAVSDAGYHYAPDPSSQTTCTIGGNVASNAGGPHTLKYGVTANHVLGLVVVLPDGEILRLGGKTRHVHGYDLKSVFIGSEGTMGVITEITVRLSRNCPACRTVLAVYDTMDSAADTVTRIIAAGMVPAALEMMDQAVINIVEDAYHYGLPRDAEALLIIEIDGVEAGLKRQLQQIKRICAQQGARRVDDASTPEERTLLWKARKTAFGAMGRLAPTCITQDGVVPRSKLPHILRFVRRQAEKYDLKIANNFHAGDGNIHPNFLFDGRQPAEVERVTAASREILAECVRLGGSVTGEHGVGIEKIEALKLMYNDADLDAQKRLRAVFDVHQLANPNKVFSVKTQCLEDVTC